MDPTRKVDTMLLNKAQNDFTTAYDRESLGDGSGRPLSEAEKPTCHHGVNAAEHSQVPPPVE